MAIHFVLQYFKKYIQYILEGVAIYNFEIALLINALVERDELKQKNIDIKERRRRLVGPEHIKQKKGKCLTDILMDASEQEIYILLKNQLKIFQTSESLLENNNKQDENFTKEKDMSSSLVDFLKMFDISITYPITTKTYLLLNAVHHRFLIVDLQIAMSSLVYSN